jgi:glucosamine--fructose-6-phosphate aminotransferase (isomerizing)
MEQEAREAPARIAEQLRLNEPRVASLRARIAERRPRLVMTLGRGSSDHAGVFAKYLLEVETGVPVLAAAPSVATVYGRALQLGDALVLAVSQSGRSPDLLRQVELARQGGAYVVALVNDEGSPLASLCDFVLPLHAGVERSVAATKSFLASLAALLHLAAAWSDDPALRAAVRALPEALDAALAAPAQLDAGALANVGNLVILARGLGLAVAKEMALKLQEVCSIHAEAFSSAEFLHGPVALANRALTVIDVTVLDESAAIHGKQIVELKGRGARVLALRQLPADAHPRIAPLLILQRFYIEVAELAVRLAHDPDRPAGLSKVTETL